MKNKHFITAAFLMLCIAGSSVAQLTPEQILLKTDDIINAPKDQTLSTMISLIDRSGKVTGTRETLLLQRGSDRRMIKFLSPADQKGIGFLSLPNDNLTVYLPAFGKTRKIASSVKNTKFAGTEYSYEDMQAKRYTDRWNPKLLKSEGTHYVLELTLKPGMSSDYSKLILYLRTSDCYPEKVEHYDKNGKIHKSLTTTKIEKAGKYTIAKETVLADHRTGRKTKMSITNVKFDTGLTEEAFTERELMK